MLAVHVLVFIVRQQSSSFCVTLRTTRTTRGAQCQRCCRRCVCSSIWLIVLIDCRPPSMGRTSLSSTPLCTLTGHSPRWSSSICFLKSDIIRSARFGFLPNDISHTRCHICVAPNLHRLSNRLLVSTVTLEMAIIAAATHGWMAMPMGRKMPARMAQLVRDVKCTSEGSKSLRKNWKVPAANGIPSIL